jgi:hypothetical protein
MLYYPDETFEVGRAYEYIRFWLGENVAATIFLLHGIGMVWRIYAPSRQKFWTRCFAAIGVVTYLGFPLAIYLALGHLTVQGISMFGWAWACAWIGRRVGTGEDRSGP